jgi:DNA-binding CsgD family transcriptional regulator
LFVSNEELERVRHLLASGRRRSEIARELEVSPSTITRAARILGFPDARPRKSQTNWAAVQDHYDAGHTIAECRDRFGFTYGAWDKAVARGDLVPRPRAGGELGRRTRDLVEDLLARGMSQADIARELDLTKSAVAYHVRGLGVRADPRFARRIDWEAVQAAIDQEGLSMARCLARFGLAKDTWYRAVTRGDIVPGPSKMPIDQLLVAGRRTSRGHLKLRLVSEGLKEDRCERCGLDEWRGARLSIQLHHKNGDPNDNRLGNLAFLCPNCHAQTDTYGGRNGHRRLRPEAA